MAETTSEPASAAAQMAAYAILGPLGIGPNANKPVDARVRRVAKALDDFAAQQAPTPTPPVEHRAMAQVVIADHGEAQMRCPECGNREFGGDGTTNHCQGDDGCGKATPYADWYTDTMEANADDLEAGIAEAIATAVDAVVETAAGRIESHGCAHLNRCDLCAEAMATKVRGLKSNGAG